MRKLLAWEKTVIKRLGVTDPVNAKRLIDHLTKNTTIVGGRLVTVKEKDNERKANV
jgi:hypothetical protein